MTEAQAAVGQDRLPWLPDDPPVRTRASLGLPWALGATILVAAASYWVGIKSSDPQPEAAGPTSVLPAETVPLRQARPAEEPISPAARRVESLEPVAAASTAIEQRGTIEHPVAGAAVQRVGDKAVNRLADRSGSEPKAASDGPAEQASSGGQDKLQLWPARMIEGASGRLVRVGTFASARDAKKAWGAITHLNPALEHIPALVVPVRSLRDRQVYYRVQMGTTSQAHSAVLCQRMRMISQSCVVIGLTGDGSEVAM